MRHLPKRFALTILAALVTALLLPGTAGGLTPPPADMGVPAYAYTQALAAGTRVAGTPAEVASAHMVRGWFDSAGYTTSLQPFTYVRSGVTYASQNVIAVKPAARKVAGSGTPLVIVGAHYDCVGAGKGADDNASGVGTMLEVAARLSSQKLPYDLVFIAFGAEEVGLEGSNYYVSQMSSADKNRAIAMVNFDSLIVGDYRYIHAGVNQETWARDAMLEIIDELDLGIRTHTSPRYPAGITPPTFSDYTAFNRAGIPIVAFESTNWEIGDLDGYLQLDTAQFEEEYGDLYAELWEIWHTPYDTLEFIDYLLGDRPKQHLEAYSTLVYVFLRDLRP